jgi:hypothetical protein
MKKNFVSHHLKLQVQISYESYVQQFNEKFKINFTKLIKNLKNALKKKKIRKVQNMSHILSFLIYKTNFVIGMHCYRKYGNKSNLH